ncbi:MAG: LuxR C-terminal-related transcriptional regulator [Brevibacterium sp.]
MAIQLNEASAVPRIFGRETELDLIRDSLHRSESSGILIEGEIGVGKTLLATTVFRERADDALWIRGDRIHQSVEFGVFGLLVDLADDPDTLLARIVSTLTPSRKPRVVFADDAHLIDARSQGVLAELASAGSIRLVVLSRTSAKGGRLPFSILVEDRILDHLVLDVLPRNDYRTMIEHALGGIVSQGVVDIVDFHSGRNPGKVIELLEYTTRRQRFLRRRGVWLLDGLDIDYDERARDYTRIEVFDYSAKEREVLELVVLAGEVQLDTLLEAGLGEAADALVVTGELQIETERKRRYAAVENHASDTIRYTTPVGRSREWYEFIAACGDSPSDWARVIRAEWGMLCGIGVDVDRLIEASRTATGFGDWHRAMRLLAEVPLETMEPHDLFEIARLYCGCNKIPLGLDILAHSVRTACCAQLVIDSLVIWMNRDFGYSSPALTLADFRTALERLAEKGDAHPNSGAGAEFGLELINEVSAAMIDGRRIDRRILGDLSQIKALPTTVHLLDTLLHATDMLDSGLTLEALALLETVRAEYRTESSGVLHLTVLRVRALLQLGRIAEAKALLTCLPTHDIAFLAARSGPIDLLWAQVHLLEGDLREAMQALHAAIEGLDYWNQSAQLAIALAEAEYAVVRVGSAEEADDLHARFDELPLTGLYHDYRRALVLRTAARGIRTSDPRYAGELRTMLEEAEADGAAAIVVLIRLLLFRHFDEIDPEALCAAATQGTGREFELVGRLGAALLDRDSTALLAIADAYGPSMPDLAGRCTGLSARYRAQGAVSRDPSVEGVELTTRERQISTLIISGLTNAEIAHELGVRVRTVEGHTYRLFRKLGVTRREQVAEAMQGAKAMRDTEGRLRA